MYEIYVYAHIYMHICIYTYIHAVRYNNMQNHILFCKESYCVTLTCGEVNKSIFLWTMYDVYLCVDI